ncbi:MAG: hypothetical protein ACLQGP_23355 [Isosphaeraceae bacterium]
MNPESLSGRFEGATYREATAEDDTGNPGAIDPAAIAVKAAVNVVYRIDAHA